ncbi:MAG TPA: hypothetical protein VFB59_04525 [Candidatus Saccharimonadales bacterium]|nr:hypothetical protein [Candidatus Saccharimonadales bacterium]
MKDKIRGIRSDHFRRAQRETDPDLRDLHLAMAEMATAGVLEAGRSHRYGSPTQDTRDVELTGSGYVQTQSAAEAFWLADGLALTKEYELAHGWDPTVDPIAGV